jgi:hypothetical protein
MKHPPVRDVGGDDPQLVAVLRVADVLVDEVAELLDLLRLQQLRDPPVEELPLVDPEVLHHVQRPTEERDPRDAAEVLELGERHIEDDVLQRGSVVPGRHQRGGDRARRGSRHVVGREARVLERGICAAEPDALHAAAFEHEVHEVLLAGHRPTLSAAPTRRLPSSAAGR